MENKTLLTEPVGTMTITTSGFWETRKEKAKFVNMIIDDLHREAWVFSSDCQKLSAEMYNDAGSIEIRSYGHGSIDLYINHIKFKLSLWQRFHLYRFTRKEWKVREQNSTIFNEIRSALKILGQ